MSHRSLCSIESRPSPLLLRRQSSSFSPPYFPGPVSVMLLPVTSCHHSPFLSPRSVLSCAFLCRPPSTPCPASLSRTGRLMCFPLSFVVFQLTSLARFLLHPSSVCRCERRRSGDCLFSPLLRTPATSTFIFLTHRHASCSLFSFFSP